VGFDRNCIKLRSTEKGKGNKKVSSEKTEKMHQVTFHQRGCSDGR